MEGAISNPQEIYVIGDIVYEILSRMPAKSVIKHTSLLYKTILSQPHFILKQTTNSSTFNGGFFIQRTWFMHGDKNTHLTFHVLPNQTPTGFGIPDDSIDYLNQRTRLLTSSQGLLIFSDLVNDRICICNPVTNTLTPIPYPANVINIRELSNKGFVLQFNPGNQDFLHDHTLVASVFVDIEDDPWKCGHHLVVYRNGNWAEQMCDLRRNLMTVHHDKPVGSFSGPNNGLVVHFLYDSLPNALRNPYFLEPYVAAYDMETMSLLMMIKAWVQNGAWVDICSLAKSLAPVRIAGRRLIVWVLETYTLDKWRMIVDKMISDMKVLLDEGDLHGCCVVDGKGLMFATLNKIYLYEMEGPNVGTIEVVRNHGL